MSTLTDLPPEVFREDGTIDAARLVAAFDDAEHARRADLYFARGELATQGLTKPWGTLEQTDENLDKLRAALELLRPFRMARVLDFGCGLGWISRVLARLQMRVHACDVAPTALRLAEAYTRGAEPDLVERIRWHLLDGPRIPLPDDGVDRILCYDALHHVPDPRAVIIEMARVLAPGGVAVFVEPNERHSQHASSQAEMRAHGVIEADFDIFAVGRIAEANGLVPGEVALTMRRVPTLSFEGFRLELARVYADAPPDAAVTARLFEALAPNTRDRRIFSLRKGGGAPDARAIAPAGPNGEGAAGRLTLRRLERRGGKVEIELLVENPGPFRWVAPVGTPGSVGLVRVGAMLRDAKGIVTQNWTRLTVPAAALEPGGSAVLTAALTPPETAAALIFDLVSEHVCWFGVPVEAPLR